MPKPARKPPRKRAPGRPGKDARRCVECENCKSLRETSQLLKKYQMYYRDWLVRGQELAEKQRDIERLRTELAEMTHRYEIRGELWQHLATKHRELADELSRIPRWILWLYAQPSMAELLRRWRNQPPSASPVVEKSVVQIEAGQSSGIGGKMDVEINANRERLVKACRTVIRQYEGGCPIGHDAVMELHRALKRVIPELPERTGRQDD